MITEKGLTLKTQESLEMGLITLRKEWLKLAALPNLKMRVALRFCCRYRWRN